MVNDTGQILGLVRKASERAAADIAACLDLLSRSKYAVMEEPTGTPSGEGESAGGNEKRRFPAVSLGEVLDPPGTCIEGAGTVPSESTDAGVQVVVPDGVRDLRFRPEHCPRIDEASASGRGAHRVRGMDIMMVKAGEHRLRCAILPLMHPGAVLGPGCIALRADHRRCNPFYLNNVLHQYLHIGYLEQEVSANGAVDPARLLSLSIPLPPPDEQRRMADRLLNISARIVDAEEAAAAAGRIGEVF